MKRGLKDIIGKQIMAVVVAESDCDPRHQVFLIFPDGTRFVFWGPHFTCCGGLDGADGVIKYVESGSGRVTAFYGGVEATEVPSSPAQRARQQLAAWQAARKLLAEAKL